MNKLNFIFIGTAILVGASFSAHAQSDSTKSSDVEMKQKMATMHENMAACLRSSKTMKECHQEMMSKGDMGDMGEMCGGMMKDHKGHVKGHDHMDGMPSGDAASKK